jgi:hypothetical protein
MLKTSSILCLVFFDSDILVVFFLLRIGSLAHQTGGSPEGGKRPQAAGHGAWRAGGSDGRAEAFRGCSERCAQEHAGNTIHAR